MSTPAGIHSLTLSAGGFERHGLVHVPAGLDAQQPWPVVLMLHGAGAAAQWTLEETGWERTAEEGRFLLVVPEALPLDPSRPPSFLKNPPLWSDGSPWGAAVPRAVDDIAFLDALLDDIGQRFPVARRVHVTGFSNGASMAFRMAAERAERVAAIAPVAGYCWLDDPRPSRPVPTCFLVGTEDPFVPLAGGTVTTPWGWVEERPPVRAMLDRWRRALGDGEVLVTAVAGLGHHWPGGRGLLARRLFGPPLHSFRANERIWEFFQRHGSAEGL